MDEQKSSNFHINPQANWKYVLIILVLASLLSGGILGYQWWWQKELEIQSPEIKIIEKPIAEQKVSVIIDKNEYERDDIIKFTIINNSRSVIHPATYEGKRLIGLQKYFPEIKKWGQPSYGPEVIEYKGATGDVPGVEGLNLIFQVFSETPIGPIPIGGKEEHTFPLKEILNQFNDELETYRLFFIYYEGNACYENTFWGNPECGKATTSSWLNENWEEIKTAISNEFKVRGTTLTEAAVARSFCLERYEGSDFYLESAFFLNFDSDEDKEIIGLCWKGEYDKEGLLFVLDKQNNQYKSVLEKEDKIAQRYYTFENLKTNDVDKDGIDEIIYEERGWYIAGGNSYLHLYSPKYQEWFYRHNWWDERTGTRKEGIKFSPNLDLEKYKVFKEFLLGF